MGQGFNPVRMEHLFYVSTMYKKNNMAAFPGERGNDLELGRDGGNA